MTTGLSTLGGLPIPAPVQKGFLKAVSRLTGALVDIPAAKLESYAEDIRAATEARKHLTHRAAGVLADGFEGNPQLAARAQARATAKVLREQINVEDVLRNAAESLGESGIKEEPSAEPDDDWWNTFEDEAAKKSSDEMKAVFGRILAGEISRPGSFSIRSVRSVGEMDRSTAELFARLCSLSINSVIEARVVSVVGNAASNALQSYGLGFAELQTLEQHGLINSDYNSWRDYTKVAALPFPIEYVGKVFRFIKIKEAAGELKLHGVSLTKIGHELRGIVSLTEQPTYTTALTDFLERTGYALAAMPAP